MNRNSFMNRTWVQKQVAKVAAYDEGQNKYLKMILNDPAAASYAGYLNQMQAAANKLNQDRAYELGVKRSDTAHSLSMARLGQQRKSDKESSRLGKWNVAAAGGLGMAKLYGSKKRADQIRANTRMLLGKG